MLLKDFTIASFHKSLLRKDFSCYEITEKILKEILETDKKYDAFLNFTPDLALKAAHEVDLRLRGEGALPVLAGVPCAIKDNVLIKNYPCTAGSKILENYMATYDATVISKLKNNLAVIIGKTNLDEFAMGISTENSAFKMTKNPRNVEWVPGGSSGGSAAAVAADETIYAIGSDTGGSIRQPAAFCGVVGLKPTYGAVSRFGLIAMASSLDQIGPIAKTVEDAKLIFNAIKGKDVMDSTSAELKNNKSDFNLKELKKIIIGVPKEYFVKDYLDSIIAEQIEEVIKIYKSIGLKIKEISLPHTKYALSAYHIIVSAEVSANMARYDGIRYGFSARKNHNESLQEIYEKSRGQGIGKEVKRRIMLGTYVLSAGYYDAYYLKAQKVRQLIKNDFNNAFNPSDAVVDVVLAPITPTPPFKLGEKIYDPVKMYTCDIFTVTANLAGLPAISIPCKTGLVTKKIPIGFQLIGKPLEEETILDLGILYEKTIN